MIPGHKGESLVTPIKHEQLAEHGNDSLIRLKHQQASLPGLRNEEVHGAHMHLPALSGGSLSLPGRRPLRAP